MKKQLQNTVRILELIKNGQISKEAGLKLLKHAGCTGEKNMKQEVQVNTSDDKNIGNTGDIKLKAVLFTQPGSIEDIKISEMVPEDPGEGEVQVLVKAFPVNFSDFLLMKGLYPIMPDYPFTPGVEVSGIVSMVGSGVTRVRPGDEVIALMRLECGGQAYFVNTDETLVVKKPTNVSHEEACGFPVPFISMFKAFEKANVKENEKVFIQAATGTNGLIAAQLAKLNKAQIFATAGSDEKVKYLRDMGVHYPINYNEEDYVKRIMEITNGRGVDVVINTIAGDAIQKGIDILAPEGRYVEIAVFGLQSSKGLNLSRMIDNQSFYSFNLKKFLTFHPEKRVEYMEIMASYLEKGLVRPNVSKVFPFNKVIDAYKAKQDRTLIGRIVVKVPEINPKNFEVGDEKCSNYIIRDSKNKTPDVAIIGMSGRFASCENTDELWENLAAGKCLIREIPQERWDKDLYYHPDHHRNDTSNSKWGGFLNNVDKFDSLFFGISGREAAQTDPQQRLFMEECWRAMEDAGYAGKVVSNKRCGIYVGVTKGDYLERMEEAGIKKEAQSFWGNECSILAARLSYFMNLKGPSLAIDTACSSSLVALHEACQAIRTGDIDMAVVGGVFITTHPRFYAVASSGGMLSPVGLCKTFDNSADGFVPGEGVGAIVLKSLEDAQRDGDNIYGIIKGTMINQDGKTNGITAPSSKAQTEVEVGLYEKYGINPETISYIEAHGTGTKLGDPIEIEALTNAFRKFTSKKQFCSIGSVKTNIGHTGAAAGITGIIKILLCMKHKKIPALLHFTKPNEHISFEDSPFTVNTSLCKWETPPGISRRAAISSFGFSGTNAHAVIEEYNGKSKRDSVTKQQWHIALLSAKSETALKRKIEQMIEWLETKSEGYFLEDICYTLAIRREHFQYRTAIVADSTEKLHDSLVEIRNNGTFVDAPDKLSLEAEKEAAELLERIKLPSLNSAQLKESLETLSRLYINGADIEWREFYCKEGLLCISLPTYPFEGVSFWTDPPRGIILKGKDNEIESIHPILGRNTSTLREQRFSNCFSGNEFFIADHIVNGVRLMPGVAYLEMARAAGEAAFEEKVKEIGNVVWTMPMEFTDNQTEVFTGLYPVDEDAEFEVYSIDTDGSRKVYCSGMIYPYKGKNDQPSRTVNISGIRQNYEEFIDGEKSYELFKFRGFNYGHTFKSIKELYLNETEVLGRIVLPEGVGNSSLLLHPSIMDGALQTIIGLVNKAGQKNSVYLPYQIGRIDILGELQKECYALGKLKDNKGVNCMYFDINIIGTDGAILLSIKDLVLRVI